MPVIYQIMHAEGVHLPGEGRLQKGSSMLPGQVKLNKEVKQVKRQTKIVIIFMIIFTFHTTLITKRE